MKKKILIVAAHPDDETLGCGGTVSRMVKDGYQASVLFLTDGESSRLNKISKSRIKNRQIQSKLACKILGIKNFFFNEFPDNQLDKISLLKIVKVIEKKILSLKPDIIFTHFANDLNIDHRIVSDATFTATRFYEKKHQILCFEILSSTNLNFGRLQSSFAPNYFVDIEKTIQLKINAMMEYDKEIRNFPHPRSRKGIEVLANYRGMHSNLKFAY